MGYDITNILPKNVKIQDIEDYLVQNSFQKISNLYFYYFDDNKNLTISGVQLSISKDSNSINVHQHVMAFCSCEDLLKMNKTAKYLYKFFGGNFVSDFGTRRYIPELEHGINIKGNEGGCYIAYMNFQQNIKRIELYVSTVKFNIISTKLTGIPQLDYLNPEIVSNNLVIPFLVSVLEDYFKYCYISLFKAASKEIKEKIFKNNRIFADDLVKVSFKQLSLEESVTKSMSFQNIKKIIQNFDELDSKIKLDSFFHRPYRKRNKDHYLFLNKLFHQRHEIIHEHSINALYTKEKLSKDIKHTKLIIKRVHLHLIESYNWHYHDTLYS